MDRHITHSPRATALAIGAIFFVNGATFGSWAPRLPEIRERLAVSDTVLGLTLVGGGLGGLTMSLVSGLLVDRVGSRAATVWTALVLLAVMPLVAVVPLPALFFILLLAIGGFDGLTDVAMNTQAIELQKGISRSILNRMHATWSIGTLVSGVITSALATTWITLGWQLTATALILGAMVVVASRFLLAPEPMHSVGPATDLPTGTTGAGTAASPAQTAVADPTAADITLAEHPAGDTTAAGATAAGTTAAGHPAAETTAAAAPPSSTRPSRRLLAGLFGIGVLAVLVELPPTEWAALLMEERHGLSVGAAGLGFVGFTAGMVVGRLSGDLLVDRFDPERVRRVSGAVAGAGLLIATTGPVPVISVVGFVIAGTGAAAMFPMAVRRAGELVPGATGVAMFSSGARLGILLGPLLMGNLSDATSRSVALAIVGVAAAIPLVAVRLPDAPDSPEGVAPDRPM